MARPDGGQAFPRAGHEGDGSISDPSDGMTLREYFAAQALAGMCADGAADFETARVVPVDGKAGEMGGCYGDVTDETVLARRAFRLADAMLSVSADSDEELWS